MSIGSQIATRREQIGMTQQMLAQMLNVSIQTVGAWEKEESVPETEKLKPLATALNSTVSFLLEEQPVLKQWELHDAMFSVDNMLRRVQMYAETRNMIETQKAIRSMLKYHDGAVRKSTHGEKIPYVIHPLMMACHAFALGIADDELIATILLHDVVEDCDVTVEDLDVNAKVKEAVGLLSHMKDDGLSKDGSNEKYYEGIRKNKIASIVKLLDRCNNVSTMATGFKPSKMVEYIEETETYVLPLLDMVKHTYDEYYNASFLLKYQIRSVMETLKRTL